MLSDHSPITTIGVKDLNRARKFYEKTLGLEPVISTMPEEVQLYRAGHGMVEIYHSEYAGSNKTTVMTWIVGENVKREVEALKEKGVSFEHYSFPDTKMDGDVHCMGHTRVAWFKDPDGNILSLVNH